MSKNLTRLVPLVAVSLSLVACAPGSNSSDPGDKDGSPADGSTPYTMTVPKGEADALTAKAELACALPGGLCPAALAMSIARIDQSETSKLYQCTAFLVSKDIVATNAHCLPADLRKAGAVCANRVNFYFGDSPQAPAEIASCDRVLSASSIVADDQAQDYNLHPDLAFLKLRRPLSRRPFPVARSGAPDDLPLTIYAVDPASNEHLIRGIARVKTCVTKQNSLLTPQYTNDFATVIAAACTVLPGNSGSPALDRDGTVRAVLHAHRPVSMVGQTAYKGFQLPDHFVEMAYFTNMTCAAAPASLDLGPVARVCNEPIPSRLDLVHALENATSVDLDLPFNTWKATAPKMFGFDLEALSANSGRAAIPRLKCLSPPDGWASSAAHEMNVDSLTVNGDQVRVSFVLPLWGAQPRLDSSERVRIQTGEIDRADTTLTFSLAFFRKNGFARTSAAFASETGRLVMTSASIDLPLCP